MASIQKFLKRCNKAHQIEDKVQKSKVLGVTIPKPFQFDKKKTTTAPNLRHSQESFFPKSVTIDSHHVSTSRLHNGYSSSKVSLSQSGVSALSRSSAFSSKSLRRPVEDNLAVNKTLNRNCNISRRKNSSVELSLRVRMM
jgi:hypothetical protein